MYSKPNYRRERESNTCSRIFFQFSKIYIYINMKNKNKLKGEKCIQNKNKKTSI